MSVDEIIEGILKREGPGVPPYLAKNDAGGRTSWGIAEKYHPEEWWNGPPTMERARIVLKNTYAAPFDGLVIDAQLRACLVDDAVMRGVITVIKDLQKVLGVTQDGVLGPQSIARAKLLDAKYLLRQYVIERTLSLCQIVVGRPTDLTNLVGWVSRALLFLP